MATPEPIHNPDAGVDHQPPDRTLPVPEGGRLQPPSGASGGEGLLAVIERLATNPALNLDVFDRLLKARREEEDRAAKRAFFAALSQAKGEFPPILKTRLVDYAHRDGRGRTSYKHEELADITILVDPILAKYGLSYRHKTVQTQGKITVTCILSHADGHSEENDLTSVEDSSGQKNPHQAIASTVTYLQRYTLKEALGLAAGRDDDGAGGAEAPAIIDADQLAYVEQLLRDTGSDTDKFLEHLGAAEVKDLTVAQYKIGVGLLEAKKRKLSAEATKEKAP